MRIGKIQLRSNLLLAPLAGHTDLPFRLTVRACTGTFGALPEAGVGLAFTELLCASAILNEATKTLWLASTRSDDQPLGMQLYGRDPEALARSAQWAEAHGATLIDINMGCPVDKITKRNGGSKLLCEPGHAVQLAARVVRSVRVAVTCKIRLGWDDTCIVGPSLAPRLADVGVAAVTVHGRTTQQMFRGSARLDGIADVVAAMKRRHPEVLVIGNGDVKSVADVKRMLAVTGCDGVMIGRGALSQPWIFRDAAHALATGDPPPEVPRIGRAALVLRHFELMMEYRGERYALNTIKPRVSWYSAALQPWPGLRHEVSTIASAHQFRDFWRQGMEKMTAMEHAMPIRP